MSVTEQVQADPVRADETGHPSIDPRQAAQLAAKLRTNVVRALRGKPEVVRIAVETLEKEGKAGLARGPIHDWNGARSLPKGQESGARIQEPVERFGSFENVAFNRRGRGGTQRNSTTGFPWNLEPGTWNLSEASERS